MKNLRAVLLLHMRSSTRHGVTLTEVLVSLAIMSIGVVLISTLLPISILRTAQATQLTQAVFLRNNAEALVESNIGLLSNSAPANILPNSLVVVDPLGSFLISPAASFGGVIQRSPGAATTLVQAENLAMLPDSWSPVAEGTVTANIGVGANPPNVVLLSPTLSGLNVRNSLNPLFAPHRLVMFDITGQFAVIEPLSQVNGNTLSWWDPSNTLVNPGPSIPNGFTPYRARIESRERRFTWLMTVRKRPVSIGLQDNSWAAEIDVAVFFNRSFNPNEEVPFTNVAQVQLGFDQANGVSGVDDDGNGVTDDAIENYWVGSDDNRTIIVTFNAGSAPPLKKGGFMLEPTQLKWYRIINFTTVTPTSTSATILLDQDIRSTPGTPIAAIFMKGIVDVYPIGVRTGQQ